MTAHKRSVMIQRGTFVLRSTMYFVMAQTRTVAMRPCFDSAVWITHYINMIILRSTANWNLVFSFCNDQEAEASYHSYMVCRHSCRSKHERKQRKQNSKSVINKLQITSIEGERKKDEWDWLSLHDFWVLMTLHWKQWVVEPSQGFSQCLRRSQISSLKNQKKTTASSAMVFSIRARKS